MFGERFRRVPVSLRDQIDKEMGVTIRFLKKFSTTIQWFRPQEGHEITVRQLKIPVNNSWDNPLLMTSATEVDHTQSPPVVVYEALQIHPDSMNSPLIIRRGPNIPLEISPQATDATASTIRTQRLGARMAIRRLTLPPWPRDPKPAQK